MNAPEPRQKPFSFQRTQGAGGGHPITFARAPQSPNFAHPFQYLNLADVTFCKLLEVSSQIAATDYQTAILNRLASFAPWLVEHVAAIRETPLQGVWRVTFKGRVSQTAMRAIDTSGLLKTVGCYQVGQGEWAISVRLVQ